MRQVPHGQLEQLQTELRRAAAHTDALEAQVQQLKQAAVAAVEEHEAAVRQQAQEGALDTAEQVAAAVQAAAERHGEEVQALHAQLAGVQQQLQAAQAELAAVQQAQAARLALTEEAGVQAGSPAAAAHHASTQTQAVVERAPLQPLAPHFAASVLQQRQQPSRQGSACESPVFGGCERLSPAPVPAASVAQTATQLQLELAKVRLTPMKPLIGGSLAGSGASAKHLPPPSRLGSAFGELGSMAFAAGPQQPLPGCNSLSGLAARRLPTLVPSNSSSHSRLATEDEDTFYATPLAQTPASLSPELSPSSSMLPPAAAAAGPGRLPHGQSQQLDQQLERQQQWQQQQQQPTEQAQLRRQGPPVPPLDLQLVRPYTSLSCDSSGREERPFRCSSAGGGGSGGWSALSAEASVPSVASLSSLGPSASQLGPAWTPAAGGGGGRSSLLPLPHDSGVKGGMSPATESGLGSNWQSAALDASLARLAALTAGLTASGSRRQGQ